jgi:hypothetical protein
MTPMQCNTPLVSEAILKKSEPLITERKSKCTRVRARNVLRMTEKQNENLSKNITCSPGLMFIRFHCVILYKDISFPIDHVPFTPDALSCAYISGYTIFKYGQLEDYCIDCYTKLITATCNARYLRLVKHLGNLVGHFSLFIIIYQFTFLSYFPDRGSLKYPCEPVTYRMWIVYQYFRQIFPQIRAAKLWMI